MTQKEFQHGYWGYNVEIVNISWKRLIFWDTMYSTKKMECLQILVDYCHTKNLGIPWEILRPFMWPNIIIVRCRIATITLIPLFLVCLVYLVYPNCLIFVQRLRSAPWTYKLKVCFSLCFHSVSNVLGIQLANALVSGSGSDILLSNSRAQLSHATLWFSSLAEQRHTHSKFLSQVF